MDRRTRRHLQPQPSAGVQRNPFSESQFKTAKDQPDYPGRFLSAEHARNWFADYVDWYNARHHHSGLAGFTPEQVFTGRYHAIAPDRQAALNAQYRAHPERFVHGPPRAAMPPEQVTINPVPPDGPNVASDAVNFPTLTTARERAPKSTSTET